MTMTMRGLVLPICACASLAGLCRPAEAALQTLIGSNFDVLYDDAQLGLFSAPTLAGDSLFFTFNNFVAESLNGIGAVSTHSTISGLVFKAKDGYRFGAFNLAEFGDYTLSGSGSRVQVQGQLRAFNLASALFTQTTGQLQLNPLTPLTINDGLNHDWSATARIDASTAPVPLPFGTVTNVILSNPDQVGLAIENRLTAFTDPTAAGFRQAFIEKKFAGVQMTVAPPSAVPLPAPMALLGAGLGALACIARRRAPVRN